jgi:hypothetical protein
MAYWNPLIIDSFEPLINLNSLKKNMKKSTLILNAVIAVSLTAFVACSTPAPEEAPAEETVVEEPVVEEPVVEEVVDTTAVETPAE